MNTDFDTERLSDHLPKKQPGWWVVTALLAALIWFLSSRGTTPVPSPHPVDWVAHTLSYLALGFSLGKATGNWRLAWIVAAWFGAADELHQAFVPPREAGIGDWWFDLLGGALGSRKAAGRVAGPPDEDQHSDSGLSAEPEHLTWPQYDMTFDEAQ